MLAARLRSFWVPLRLCEDPAANRKRGDKILETFLSKDEIERLRKEIKLIAPNCSNGNISTKFTLFMCS
jgi:hypothetical protein